MYRRKQSKKPRHKILLSRIVKIEYESDLGFNIQTNNKMYRFRTNSSEVRFELVQLLDNLRNKFQSTSPRVLDGHCSTESIDDFIENKNFEEQLVTQLWKHFLDDQMSTMGVDSILDFLNELGIDSQEILSLVLFWKMKVSCVTEITFDQFSSAFCELKYST